MGDRLNAWLDGLPRSWVQRRATPLPAFLSLGVAGYYLAVVVTLLTGLWAGRSPLILLAVSGACAISFFVYAATNVRASTPSKTPIMPASSSAQWPVNVGRRPPSRSPHASHECHAQLSDRSDLVVVSRE